MTYQEEQDAAFETVIETVGNDGRFQKRFNYLFNFVLVIVASMPYFNIVIALSVPEHWCNVPGRESTNYSVEEWKEIHIPKEEDARGLITFSKCKMYNRTEEDDILPNIVACQHGWEFDKTWYTRTAPSQEEWVCDKELYVPNTLMISRIGEVIGTFIFGQMADAIGRRPVFYMTVVTIVLGRMLSTVTAPWISMFFLAAFMGNLPSMSVFQGPLVIAMEISKTSDRAYIAMLQCVGWTIGICLLPLIMWFFGDWVVFMAITSLPVALFLLSDRFMIESPRWLATKGRTSKCIQQLEKIARINQTELPQDVESMLTKINGGGKSYGVLGLFSSWRLAKNTALLIWGWSVTMLVYYFLTLNIGNLGGNPFLNFLLQGMSEFPAYIVAKYVSDKFGRRWTNVWAFTGTMLGCIPVIFLVHDESKQLLVAYICVFLKFSISFAFFVVSLQSLETYPTCIRQTGISIGGIFGNAVGVFGPYMVYIGTSINATYPYILCICLCGIAAVCSIFLPETLNKKLPESLEEAATFGADQNIWGAVVEVKYEDDAEKPLK